MTFLAVINLVGQSLYFNKIANDADLFSNKNYLPALSYILFTSLLPEWNYLSAPIISNWLLLFALSGMLKLQGQNAPRKIIFNIGFAISCAGILSLPYFSFFILIFLALSILRPFKLGEWTIALLGFLTPLYFLTGILFLTNQLSQISGWIPQDFKIVSNFSLALQKPLLCFAFAILMAVVGLIYLNKHAEHMLTQVKKRWSIAILGLIVGLSPLFFEGVGGRSVALPTLVLLSLIAANSFMKRKKRWPTRILFYVFLAVLIFAEWIPVL